MATNTDPNIHEQVICANVFIRKDSKYLLLRRSPLKKHAPNFVHPVGGKVEPGENPFTAAVREAKEETGLTIKNVRLEAVLLEVQPYKDQPYDWQIFHFSADYAEGELQPTDEGELVLLSADEIKAERLFPSVREIIEDILDEDRGTVFATFAYEAEEQNIVKRAIDLCAR